MTMTVTVTVAVGHSSSSVREVQAHQWLLRRSIGSDELGPTAGSLLPPLLHLLVVGGCLNSRQPWFRAASSEAKCSSSFSKATWTRASPCSTTRCSQCLADQIVWQIHVAVSVACAVILSATVAWIPSHRVSRHCLFLLHSTGFLRTAAPVSLCSSSPRTTHRNFAPDLNVD